MIGWVSYRETATEPEFGFCFVANGIRFYESLWKSFSAGRIQFHSICCIDGMKSAVEILPTRTKDETDCSFLSLQSSIRSWVGMAFFTEFAFTALKRWKLFCSPAVSVPFVLPNENLHPSFAFSMACLGHSTEKTNSIVSDG